MSETDRRCVAVVTHDSWHPDRCSRRATVERGGKGYCTQHDPERIAAQREASSTRYEQERIERAKQRIAAAVELLRCEGYTVIGPRG